MAKLASSRRSLQQDRSRIRRQVHPLLRLRTAVRNKPLRVFAATAGAAFLLTLLLRRRRREAKPFSAKRMILGWALALARPAAQVWLTNWARTHPALLPVPLEPPDSDHTP